MEAGKFDRWAVSLAGQRSRREVLKGILGLAAAASAGAVAVEGAEAARRGFSGPRPGNTTPEPCVPECGEGVCGISNGCGGTCTCEAGRLCDQGECKAECEILGLCAP